MTKIGSVPMVCMYTIVHLRQCEQLSRAHPRQVDYRNICYAAPSAKKSTQITDKLVSLKDNVLHGKRATSIDFSFIFHHLCLETSDALSTPGHIAGP